MNEAGWMFKMTWVSLRPSHCCKNAVYLSYLSYLLILSNWSALQSQLQSTALSSLDILTNWVACKIQIRKIGCQKKLNRSFCYIVCIYFSRVLNAKSSWLTRINVVHSHYINLECCWTWAVGFPVMLINEWVALSSTTAGQHAAARQQAAALHLIIGLFK